MRISHTVLLAGTTGAAILPIVPLTAAASVHFRRSSSDGAIRNSTVEYLIQGNTGTLAAPGTFANGHETHHPVTGSGCGNVWRDNVSDLGGAGRHAVNVTSTSKYAGNLNVVHSSNSVRNPTGGLTNISATTG